jgi:nucleoside-diphosphate-sugar epimerase
LRHLITGGSGFLGNLISSYLLKRGESVRVIDIWDYPQRSREIEFVEGSVTDRDAVRRCLKQVDIVHHTAAMVPLTKSVRGFREVNVEGSKIVAEESVQADVRSFIHMSSSAVFGCAPCPIGQNTPTKPLEAYGQSKLDGEIAVREIAQQHSLPLIIVRPRTILGSDRLGIFQILFEWISENRNVYVLGDGSAKIQFLHATDLIDAYLLVQDNGKPGTYNIGTDRYSSIREDLESLIVHSGKRAKVRSLPVRLAIKSLTVLDKIGLSPLAPWHYLTYAEDFYFDLTPLKNLGWKAKYSNAEMLNESYDYFIAHHDELMSRTAGSAHRKPVKEGILHLLKMIS